MTGIKVRKSTLRSALVDAWKANLKERAKAEKYGLPVPSTPEEAKQSLPAIYALWCIDYQDMGGTIDWEIIPPAWRKNVASLA